MTGADLEGRIVRRVEVRYDAVATAACKAGVEPSRAHELALKEALRLLGEALQELRERGLFPFPDGELPVRSSESQHDGGQT